MKYWITLGLVVLLLATMTSAAPQFGDGGGSSLGDAIRRGLMRIISLPSQALNRLFSSNGQQDAQVSSSSTSDFVPGEPLG